MSMDFTVIDAKGTGTSTTLSAPRSPIVELAELGRRGRSGIADHFVVPADEMTLQVGDGFDDWGSVTIPA